MSYTAAYRLRSWCFCQPGGELCKHFMLEQIIYTSETFKTASKSRQTGGIVYWYKWSYHVNGSFMDIRHGKESNQHCKLRKEVHVSMQSFSVRCSCPSMIIDGFQSFRSWQYSVLHISYHSVSVCVSLVDIHSFLKEKLFLRDSLKQSYLFVQDWK